MKSEKSDDKANAIKSKTNSIASYLTRIKRRSKSEISSMLNLSFIKAINKIYKLEAVQENSELFMSIYEIIEDKLLEIEAFIEDSKKHYTQ